MSPAQFEASERGDVPGLEQVREGVWSLGVAMPGGHIPFSLSYLVEDGGGSIHVIDPGWGSDQNWNALVMALEAIGRSVAQVATITATHLHPDHLGMADRLSAASGAPIVLHEREQLALRETAGRAPGDAGVDEFDRWGVPPERRAELDVSDVRSAVPTPGAADVLVADGELLAVPGRALRVIHTPGHTPGHICVRDAESGLVFTGDHVLPSIHAGIGLGGSSATNPIADYLQSLEIMSAFDDDEVGPGHEYRFRGLAERCATTAEHHLRRSREVSLALEADDEQPVWQIASALTWSAGWANLRSFYLLSALAQTAMHVEFVRSDAGRRFLAA